MNSNKNRKRIISQRRKQLEKRYGPNPLLYSSGNFTTEKDYSDKIKINLKCNIIEDSFSESK